jgi:hypothetical protein
MNSPQPLPDPIAEIHNIRELLAKQYHNDLHRYSQSAESHCRALGFHIVDSPRRQPIQENPIHIEGIQSQISQIG